ncbi:MAG: hypothetical protein LQ350_005926 [Teloschistes chrysophthalmus]|nr:MAG: hypothetical protein LQ350_005926 [Niorma chrysophthalma]
MGFLDNAPNLLMICWELDFERYRDLTCKEVTRIAKYINDEDNKNTNEAVLNCYENFDIFASKYENMKPDYEKALKKAEVLNKKLDKMRSHDFMTLVRGKIWTYLSDGQITEVYAYQKYINYPHLFPSLSRFCLMDEIPRTFWGRTSEMPTRALDWAKRVRKAELNRCIQTTEAEMMEWKELARHALGPGVNVPMR